MTEAFHFGWATLTAVGWLAAALWAGRGQRSIGFLRDEPMEASFQPFVTFVIAARNEESSIEKAVTSMLAQHYAAYDVLVVNDRSMDGTGEILARLNAMHSRLRVITVTELPSGWIGKNHALKLGALQAKGELLVFADADILMDPSVLPRAVSVMEKQKLDHLAVAPQVSGKSFLLQALISGFTLNFAFYAAPWKARDPKSSRFIGVGAFNLVRASAYQAIGTHAAFPFSPIDDMELGRRLKHAGFKQDLRFGVELMSVEWYRSIGELGRGLEKNAFAGAFYRWDVVLAGTVLAVISQIWPFFAVFLTSGVEKALYMASILLILGLAMDNTRYHGQPFWMALFFPFSALFGVYAVWRSALLAQWRGGIEWRGTRYSLADLKKSGPLL